MALMSIDHEKQQIIKYLLGSFKNKELFWINAILLKYKEFYEVDNQFNIVRKKIRNIEELTDLKIILEDLLNQLNIFKLRIIKNEKIYLNYSFIEIYELKKMKKDTRFINFIKELHSFDNEKKFEHETSFKLPELEINDILNFQEIIQQRKDKDDILNYFKSRYSYLINNKKNLNKYIENNDFLIWAFNYLNKKDSFYLLGSPINHEEYKNYINEYFDSIFINNKLQYEKEIETLKKAWQQKQFRDQGKTKKEYHLPLTKQTKNELSSLAKFNNLSENSMLEKLIHQAYLTEMCDEKGKSKF